MFFWYFPTPNPAGKDDVVIWFNGFLQENGPISWRPGVFDPVPNPWSWHKLANVIWVKYPVGTGFSSGPVTAKDNNDAAQQFLQFWENFLDTFDLHYKNIYITGESYTGVHVPYFGAAMLEKNNTKLFNVKGALYYDPVLPYSDTLGLDHAALPAFQRYWTNVLAFPQGAIDKIDEDNHRCRLDAYLNKYLSYPPPGRPWPKVKISGCDAVADFDSIASVINPCFNPYHVLDYCPVLWDVLGFPGAVSYTPNGATVFFNQPAVRQSIHVPIDYPSWSECQGPVFIDNSDHYNGPEHEARLRTLIERTNNVMVGSGLADYVIQPNVTALGIQYLRWNGKQGFQTAPTQKLVLPAGYSPDTDIPGWAGGNEQGTFHTERGFTHSTVYLSGHMIPQYTPSVAFRHLEFVLGRIASLGDAAPYSVNISSTVS
ncbi:hypothetical protein M409DRAFT_27414 [Zasmidium cellare ATCC 36951]|uniref:Carboxypeptidase n=1 Tax=Zasmidium cellare ATCC 36951 TaxID=1080233 RepID=A0A6A6C4I6_ZASCE|nr:uncharacterized protein M409DRAFT_27414 [Zasmidium cellare ATCC 36951]KAF2162034.1 hypothetical protein M409DRAFT_27414 [Zasmidium cellare ATCC 36951]